MKGGFLDKAIARDAANRPKASVAPGKKEWDQETLDCTVKVFLDILNENNAIAKNDLERRVRSGTGVREFRSRCCGAPDTPVPKEDQDIAYRLITENTKPSALAEMVAPVMEQAAAIYGRVKDKGKQDRMVMDSETETKVLRDVLKECIIRHILKLINNENSGVIAAGSHDAGLLATPQGYFGGDLNTFSADCVRDLMEKGYGYQDNFVDDTVLDDVFSELDFLDADGRYTEVQQQKMTGYRTDRILWLNYEGLDREKQPGLVALMKLMISVPFELNKKCNLYLQASSSFQLAAYPVKAFYKRHVDGGYDDLNNGRKITAIFYANKSWSSQDGGQLRVYKRRPNPYQVAKLTSQGAEAPEMEDMTIEEEIEPRGGRIVLFRSRDVPHEVLPCRRKRFAISLWLAGPPGPGDQPDDHHTPT
mmetsp:Transcript_29055/g.76827  ORF Transcript_29055/g.76827 Transcript_29055/m.76827 type:complete len:420 (-) Transcript_29055:50-1309(-)